MIRVSFLLSAHCQKKRTTMINNAGNGKRSIERGRMRRRVERLGFGKKLGFFFFRRKKWRGGRVGEVWGTEKKKQREKERSSVDCGPLDQ